jgi:hypothetical protein
VSKCWKQEKTNWKCLGSSSQDSAQSGSTGQCPVRQAGSCELAALRISSAAYDYNSPDCPVCTGLSGEPTVGYTICARHVAEPTVGRGHRTVRCTPDSVRCANGSQAPTVGSATEGKKSAPDSVRCAPDCPVHQMTEGKNCLPRVLSTAPSCLGAIKGTPRHMEEHTKHSLSTLDHSHSILAHLFDVLVI